MSVSVNVSGSNVRVFVNSPPHTTVPAAHGSRPGSSSSASGSLPQSPLPGRVWGGSHTV